MRAPDLLDRNPGTWREATRHPFLDAVRAGTMPAGLFQAWMAQDYLFAADLLVFQSRLLARAPRPDQAALAGGLVAVEAELGGGEGLAAKLEGLLDRYSTDTPALRYAYRRAMALEVAFFKVNARLS